MSEDFKLLLDPFELAKIAAATAAEASTFAPGSKDANRAALIGTLIGMTLAMLQRARDQRIDLEDLYVKDLDEIVAESLARRGLTAPD